MKSVKIQLIGSILFLYFIFFWKKEKLIKLKLNYTNKSD